MKKIKLLSVLLLVLLVVGCGCSKKEAKKPKKNNSNEPAINYKKVGDLKVGSKTFYISGEYTFVSISFINDTNKDITPNSVTIVLKDEAGNVIKNELIKVGTIKAKETKEIKDHQILGKYTTTSDIDYIIK